MQITVKRLDLAGSGRPSELTLDQVETSWTVKRLKKRIEQADGPPAVNQRLVFTVADGTRKELRNHRELSSYGIGLESVLELTRTAGRGLASAAGACGGLGLELAALCSVDGGVQRRWRQLAEEVQDFQHEKDDLVERNSTGSTVSPDDKFPLNVGGVMFEGSRRILCAVEDSHLAELFSGRWEDKILTDSTGAKFVDAEPQVFGPIMTMLERRVAHPDEEPSMPLVPEELQSQLEHYLVHFGLGHLFPQLGAQRGLVDAPARQARTPSAEPEPAAAAAAAGVEEGLPPEEVEVEEEDLTQVQLIAEGEQLVLAAGTIDHIVSAEFGRWDGESEAFVASASIDVTRFLGREVDDEGGLSIRVSCQSFGRPDPSPGGEGKHLRVCFVPCDAWERGGTARFEELQQRLREKFQAERMALRCAIRQLREAQLDLQEEKQWVRPYTEGETVEMQVGLGGVLRPLCTKRSTLTQGPAGEELPTHKMALDFAARTKAAPVGARGGARREEVVALKQQVQRALNAGQFADVARLAQELKQLEEGGKPASLRIEEDAWSFCRAVDQLRAVAIARGPTSREAMPPAVVVPPHAQEFFGPLVQQYFAGLEGWFVEGGGGGLVRGPATPPLEALRAVQSLGGHSDYVRALAWDSGSRTLFSASDDESVKVWREADGSFAEAQSLGGYSGWVYALAWDSGSRTLFSGSDDSSVKVWREADGSFAEAQSLGGHSSPVYALAWDPGSHTLFSGSYDNSVKVWRDVAS